MNVVCCFNDEATHYDSTVTMIAIDVSPPRTSRETDPNDGFQLVESRKRKKFSNTSPEINPVTSYIYPFLKPLVHFTSTNKSQLFTTKEFLKIRIHLSAILLQTLHAIKKKNAILLQTLQRI